MRIDRDRKGLERLRTAIGHSVYEVKKTASASFEQELQHQEEAEARQLMGSILQEVDRIGERLKHRVTVHDLIQYKNRVKDFLKEAMARAYLLKQDVGAGRRGRTILISIKTVDREVNALLNDFMNHKKDPVEILAAIDKMRGIMVDMMI